MLDVSWPCWRTAPPASERWRPRIPRSRGAATPADRRAWSVLIGQECVSGPPWRLKANRPLKRLAESVHRYRPTVALFVSQACFLLWEHALTAPQVHFPLRKNFDG